MFSLITKETCSHEAEHCANHDQNMFVLSMNETTSRGIFDQARRDNLEQMSSLS